MDLLSSSQKRVGGKVWETECEERVLLVSGVEGKRSRAGSGEKGFLLLLDSVGRKSLFFDLIRRTPKPPLPIPYPAKLSYM